MAAAQHDEQLGPPGAAKAAAAATAAADLAVSCSDTQEQLFEQVSVIDLNYWMRCCSTTGTCTSGAASFRVQNGGGDGSQRTCQHSAQPHTGCQDRQTSHPQSTGACCTTARVMCFFPFRVMCWQCSALWCWLTIDCLPVRLLLLCCRVLSSCWTRKSC
jgi:hypothetical protein